MRRVLPILLLSVALVATACNSGSGSPSSSNAPASPSTAAGSSPSAASGPTVEITYAYWSKDKTGSVGEIVKAFEREHANITVRPVLTPAAQYWTKLQTELSGGNAPDIVTMNGPNFDLYASNGALVALDEFIAKDNVDTSVFPKGLTDLYTYDQKKYALPENFATIALWYNKDLFDGAGVGYPNENWAWDDLKAAAKKLTNQSAGVYGIAAGADPGYMAQENYYNTIAQAGGFVVSADGKVSGFDDPKTIQGLQFWSDLLQAGVSPTYQQMTDTQPSDMFASGKVAMFFGGTWRPGQWAKSAVKEAVDVAPLPKGPAGPGTTVHGTGNAITRDSKHPQEAWEFVKFIESKAGQEIAGASGDLIPAYAGTQDTWLKSMPQFHLQVYVDALNYAVPYPISKNTAAWQHDADEILSQAWSGQTDVAAAARQLAQKMNADLAKEN